VAAELVGLGFVVVVVAALWWTRRIRPSLVRWLAQIALMFITLFLVFFLGYQGSLIGFLGSALTLPLFPLLNFLIPRSQTRRPNMG
jgi:uncharacterized membrane protein YGL010W